MSEARKALLEKLEAAHSKTTVARDRKKAKPQPSAWRAIWHDALREHYPECVVAYTGVEGAMLKRCVARGVPATDMGPMLAWAIANWPNLRRTVFSNYNKAVGPDTPDVRMIVAHISRVHAAYRRTKPDVALSLPLARRSSGGNSQAGTGTPGNAERQLAPAPARPKPVINPAPIRRPAALPKIDRAKIEAAQQKLGLKRWD
jgi:hypothetical protein